MTNDLGKSITHRSEQLFNGIERKNAEVQWRLISEFILPNQYGAFLSTSNKSASSMTGNSTPGAKTTKRLYESTAVISNRDLASATHSALTNPAQQWIKMVFGEKVLSNDAQSVQWLETVNSSMNKAVSESNYDMEATKAFPSYTALGNMMMVIEEDIDEDGRHQGIRFEAPHLSNIVWEENAKGFVDSYYRQHMYTATQAIELFGDKVGKEVLKALDKDPNKEFLFVQAVYKRKKSEIKINEFGQAAPKNRPYASIFVDITENKVVKEDGYYEFPLVAARYEMRSGEKYGRGPGHVALPDVRSLNALRKEEMAGAALMNRPPLEVTQRDILGTLDLRPAGLIPVRQQGTVSPLNIGLQPGVTTNERTELREQIKKAFFIDKLLLPPRNEIGEMTAQEVRQRAEEVQRVFGPTLGRLNHEFLEPLAQRIFKILFRAGALPELPPQLIQVGVNVEIRFVNQFAKAQQLEDVSNILGFANEISLLAQLKPEVLDFFDADAALREIARIRATPEAIVATEEEVGDMRQQRAQQMQQQQMMDAGTQMADIAAKTGGEE